MKIYDMHIHANKTVPQKDTLLREMEQAGVTGGVILSSQPLENGVAHGLSYEERMEEVFSWTEGSDGRLFPVLWVHPDEKGILRKIDDALNKGIMGFKFICNDYYPGEKKTVKVLSAITEARKPIIFHSGILWDGGASSKYNRPLAFEDLIEIKGIRFSMGHCSWPWTDECIALYGKFLNGLVEGRDTEMFFDLTPGTPRIYREDLLYKLFNVGYDVPNNIMFGTDSGAENYKKEWAGSWIEFDNKIYDKLGVGEEIREKIYEKNLMRFLGLSEEKVSHISPVPDNAEGWKLK